MDLEQRREDEIKVTDSPMHMILWLLRIVLLLSLASVVALGLLVAGAYGLGVLGTHLFDLSVGDATITVIVAAAGLALSILAGVIAARVSRHNTLLSIQSDRIAELMEEEDEEDDDEELDERIEALVEERIRIVMSKALPKVNSPCPCGSGRKYRNCCGR